MALLTASQLASIQGVAESGMTTSVAIYHGTNVRTANGQERGYAATPDLTVTGWLTEMTSIGAKLGVIDGQTAIAETHRLFLPVGTDCRTGDKVVIGGTAYYVQHTNAGDTYQATLTVYLRVQK